jgi:hypothetical protein
MVPQNAFQALMQRWTSMGAYNALHLMRLAGQPERDLLLRSISTAIAPLGLKPPPALAVTDRDLTVAITAELNRPFGADDAPLRFFVIPSSTDDCHIGVTFDHWIADSQSIRLVMRRILTLLRQPDIETELPGIRANETPFDELFTPPGLAGTLAGCMQSYFNHRRAHRPLIGDPLDFTAGFQHQQLPDGLIARIRSCAKRLGAKVNDVFLGAAALALARHTGAAAQGKTRRDGVSMSVAVDLRPFARKPTDDVFGFFLGFFSVLIRRIASAGLDDVVRQIVPQTQPAKSAGHVLRLFQAFKLANLYWRFSRNPARRAQIFHRTMPMLGGISNVNLTDSWIGRDSGILDYIRVSPAGPIVPIVFTLTTIRERLSLCVTHRTAVFPNDQAAAIVTDFVERLTSIEG